MESITRRKFLKQTIGGTTGLMLSGSFASNMISAQQPLEDMGRVVIVRYPGATDAKRSINAASAQTMMDESIKQLTGLPSAADAWGSILPDFEEDHLVAIKVNAVSQLIPTHPVVIDSIVKGLASAGVMENNIIIYDMLKPYLIKSGYKYNKGETGVRCIATNISGAAQGAKPVEEEGWGHDWDNPVDILGQKITLSKILTRCDHLINVPVLKVHMDPFGVTLSLKNHYGSVDNPRSLHDNFVDACAELNNQEAIRDKTRLVVTDALLGFWGSNHTMFVVDFAPNSLIMSRDPVAADFIGTEMLNEELANHNQPPREVPLLAKAAEMGLGTNNPEKIDLVQVDL